MGAELIGPFSKEFKLAVDGYRVPYVSGHKLSENEYNLCVDERFSIVVHKDDLDQFAWLLANAMAVAAGFTCHGENSQTANRFKTQIMQVGSIDTDSEED